MKAARQRWRDPMSVVDGDLKIYGVEDIRVADASIMPHITTGTTMALSVVIDERTADILKDAYGLETESGSLATHQRRMHE